MKVFVTGISGGLGREFLPHGVDGCAGRAPFAGFPAADLTRPETAEELLAAARPDVVIHTVGRVDVDACETDPAGAAAVNFNTLLNLRRWADPMGFRLVYMSTNDVFAGDRGRYREEERPEPINVYSMTKAAAESLLRPQDLVVRAPLLAWHCRGKSPFLRWMVERLEAGGTATLFTDQFTSPVTATTLARLILERFLEERGILHVGTERNSRWEVARIVAAALGLPQEGIRRGSIDDHDFVAPRPRDVSLDTGRMEKLLGRPLRLEEEAEVLRSCRPAAEETAAAAGGGER